MNEGANEYFTEALKSSCMGGVRVPTVCVLESEGTSGVHPHSPPHLTEPLFATACAGPASFGGPPVFI